MNAIWLSDDDVSAAEHHAIRELGFDLVRQSTTTALCQFTITDQNDMLDLLNDLMHIVANNDVKAVFGTFSVPLLAVIGKATLDRHNHEHAIPIYSTWHEHNGELRFLPVGQVPYASEDSYIEYCKVIPA